jgi:hypothetical protein
MQSITSDMVKAIKANFPMLLIFAAILAALPLILPSKSQNSGSGLVVSSIIIYYLHRQVLFDLPMSLWGKARPPEGVDMPAESVVRFIFVSLLFTLLFVVPAAFVGYKWSMLVRHRFDETQFIGMTMTVGAVLLWILLSAFGTALPAAASKLPFSPSRAFQAGRKTGLRVAMQLVLFPGLTFVAVLGLLIVVGQILDPDALAAPLSFGFDIVATALFLIPSVMTVVILVRAFKAAYPAP